MTCSGADGTCDRPARKAGLCWGHYARRKPSRTGGPPVSASLRETAPRGIPGPPTTGPLRGLYAAALRYRDELETATDEEWDRGRRRFQDALYRYVDAYLPGVLRKYRFSPLARAEVDGFLKKYGNHNAKPRSKK